MTTSNLFNTLKTCKPQQNLSFKVYGKHQKQLETTNPRILFFNYKDLESCLKNAIVKLYFETLISPGLKFSLCFNNFKQRLLRML